MIKKQFSRAQRAEIAKLFNDDLSNCEYYGAMGPTQKAILAEGVRLFYTPKSQHERKLPAVECDEVIKKNEEGAVISHTYIFELELSIPGFPKEIMALKFKRELKKSMLDNVI